MIVIIPARHASTRLPGKPLADVCGKPLVQRVHECARTSRAERVIIATDDARIAEVASGFGAEVCMTAETHRSGTERLAEVVERLGIDADEIIINLQGDEPLMPGALIDQVADTLATSSAPMATASHAIDDPDEINDPNVVKVVCDCHGNAITFSRATIPYLRDGSGEHAQKNLYHRHIGIYGYRAGFLARYVAWPPCAIEQAEALEQLRVLWHGESIAVCEAVALPGPGIDTPADLERVCRMIQQP